jgi:hypothetical protein
MTFEELFNTPKPTRAQKEKAAFPIIELIDINEPKLSEDFWEAWKDFVPSANSLFKKSKWPAKHTIWNIVKRGVEGLR